MALLLVPAASAQATAARVDVVSGNGQLICPVCPYKYNVTFFRPMVVKVSDANGNPIAGKTVNWGLISSYGFLPSFDTTSVTNSSGIAFSRLYQGVLQGGNALQPFLQTVINASADAASINFTETQALVDTSTGNNSQIVFSQLNAPIGVALTGPAGGTGTVPIQIHVDGRGTVVPGVSVRILNNEVTTASGLTINDPTLPSASCATAPGADPGSVLTDANGNATCYPVFGPVAGNGAVSALVGGLDPAQFDQSISPQPLTGPIAYDEYTGIQIVVTPVTPGQILIVSGNSQTVTPGKSSAPLVVKVTDSSGAVPISNQNISWAVTPAGAATVSPAVSSTDATGQSQAVVTLAPNASGSITVRAALTGSYSGISTTFSIIPNIQIAQMIKVSGDTQTTQAGQSFPSPLIVQVIGTNNQPVSGTLVSFQVTNGAAVLSTQSALTDATGIAQVTVTAGATAGSVSINAFVGTYAVTFTLTIIPPGPALVSTSFYNAAGLTRIAALSPCSLVTVIASGLAPNVQGTVLNTSAFGPWATSLASDTVTVSGIAAPIYSVGNVNSVQQLTFQVPCETALGSAVPIAINVSGGTGTINFPVVAAGPGIYNTVMSDGSSRAVALRPDGSFVSLQNPARRGEAVRVFVTGLGPAAPSVGTGALPVPGADSLALGQVIVGVSNAGTPVYTARLSPSLIGIYEVTFLVPSNAPTGNDVVLSVAVNAVGDTQTRFSNGSKLPIQ